MKEQIQFKLFGGLQFARSDGTWRKLEEVELAVGKKQLAFLTYLLIHHGKEISGNDLITHFWPNDSKDPANSLKNMIYKVRALLRSMFPDIPDFLMTQSGYYLWNPAVEIETDLDALEGLYRKVKLDEFKIGAPDVDNLLALYTGDIMPGVSMEWLDYLNTYYRTVYIDLCRSLVMQLVDESAWDQVIRVCSYVYGLAPEIEEFTLCIMQAMINTGVAGQAIQHYENYRSMLWNQFRLVPSAAVEGVHALAVYSNKSTDDAEQKIMEMLSASEEQREAFQCNLLVFQNIIQLELRHMKRSKLPSAIVVLHVESSLPTPPSATDIRRVERTLLSSLRAGDPLTRLDRGSFALLLSSATLENADMVMKRIEQNFRDMYPRSRASLRYRVYPLQTEKDEILK